MSKSVQPKMRAFDLEDFLASISKDLGVNTVALAIKAEARKRSFLSSGVHALDYVMGGGFPQNCITEIRGAFSSLKSTVCYRAIANHQKRYPRGIAVYEDGEKGYDPIYARKAGIDLSRLVLINADSGEQAVDAISRTLKAPVEVFCVVDSIASLVPAAEIDASMDKAFMGLHARLVNRAMRVLTKRLKVSMYDNSAPGVTVVATNQMREKVGVIFGNPETSPGGRGREFYYHMMIKFNSPNAERLMVKVVRNGIERETRVGQTINFVVSKNKCGGTQFEEGTFQFFTRPHKFHSAYEFSNEEASLHFGRFHGVITTELPAEGEGKHPRFSYGDLESLTEQPFLEALHDDHSLHAQLYSDILAAVRTEDDVVVVTETDDFPVARPVTKKMRVRN